MKNMREIVASLDALKTLDGQRAYREWAMDPRTATYLTLVADLLQPPPLSEDQLSKTHATLNALVRRELIESFVDLAFRLESVDLGGDSAAPDPDYGSDDELARVREEIRALTQRASERVAMLDKPVPAPASTPKRRRKTTHE